MPAAIIDGKALADRIRKRIAADVAEFVKATSVTPHLTAILVGDDGGSTIYVRNKQQACSRAGIQSTLKHLPSTVTQSELLDLIQSFNENDAVHGILVQLPLPKHIDATQVLDAVSPLKDVDCFHPQNVGLVVQGRPRFLPCTPAGIRELLIESGTPIEGAHAVVLGRSEIVGKPVALLLMQRGQHADATVTICHSRTKDLASHTRSADILIAALGSPRFVTAEMVKPGATVIDVGTSRVNGKVVGDVDFDGVKEVAAAITPVPGGVGPMTVTMLLQNTLTAARLSAAGKSAG